MKKEIEEWEDTRRAILLQKQADRRQRFKRITQGLPEEVVSEGKVVDSKHGEEICHGVNSKVNTKDDFTEETRSFLGNLTLTPRTKAREARRREGEEA